MFQGSARFKMFAERKQAATLAELQGISSRILAEIRENPEFRTIKTIFPNNPAEKTCCAQVQKAEWPVNSRPITSW